MQYKYQLNIDGTVAAYRFPYLLASNAVVFKQESPFYEHFYKKLVPHKHYIPVKRDLSDLVEKIKWAQENDNEVQKITKNAQRFVRDNLLPRDIYCYHVLLLKVCKMMCDLLYSFIYNSLEMVRKFGRRSTNTTGHGSCSNTIKYL